MTPEQKVKRMVVKKFRAAFPGMWHFFPSAGTYGKRGVPDLVMCIGGLFVAIECKSTSAASRVTPAQKEQLLGIQAASGLAAVVWDEASCDAVLGQVAQVLQAADAMAAAGAKEE